MAIPEYLNWTNEKENRKEFEITFREIVRVLKKGGKAFLAPGHKHHSFIHETLAKLKIEGLIDYESYSPDEPQKSSVLKLTRI